MNTCKRRVSMAHLANGQFIDLLSSNAVVYGVAMCCYSRRLHKSTEMEIESICVVVLCIHSQFTPLNNHFESNAVVEVNTRFSIHRHPSLLNRSWKNINSSITTWRNRHIFQESFLFLSCPNGVTIVSSKS